MLRRHQLVCRREQARDALLGFLRRVLVGAALVRGAEQLGNLRVVRLRNARAPLVLRRHHLVRWREQARDALLGFLGRVLVVLALVRLGEQRRHVRVLALGGARRGLLVLRRNHLVRRRQQARKALLVRLVLRRGHHLVRRC